MMNYNKNYYHIFFAFVFFLIISVSVIFLGRKPPTVLNRNIKKNVYTKPEVKKLEKKAKILFKPLKGVTLYTPGEIITIAAYADSINIPVSTFDVVIEFEPSIVRFERVMPMLSDFDIFTVKKNGIIYITGSKKLASNREKIFEDTHLFSIEFRAVNEGNPNFKVKHEKGSRKDSNIFGHSRRDILDEVSVVPFYIGKKINLKKNAKYKLNENLSVSIADIYFPPKACFDCIKKVTLELEGETFKKNFIFKEGGIAGELMSAKKIFGFIFEIREIDDGLLKIIVARP